MEKERKKPTIRSLINTIGKLKSEHQITVFKLNKLNEKLTDDLSLEREKNVENKNIIGMLTNKNQTLLHELKELKCKVNPEKNTIDMLKEKNQMLLHELNDLKCEVNSKSIEGTKSDDEEHEVEEIIDDKMIKRIKHYLVKWKGYDHTHNLWLPKKDLNCKVLLCGYEKSKQKKKTK